MHQRLFIVPIKQPPQYNRIFLIGNPTRHRIVRGVETVETLGVTVLYAGLFLVRSGIPVSIVGNGDKDMLAWIKSRGIGSDHFTLSKRVVAFENRYGPGGRHQLAQPGRNISFSEIPNRFFKLVRYGSVLF